VFLSTHLTGGLGPIGELDILETLVVEVCVPVNDFAILTE